MSEYSVDRKGGLGCPALMIRRQILLHSSATHEGRALAKPSRRMAAPQQRLRKRHQAFLAGAILSLVLVYAVPTPAQLSQPRYFAPPGRRGPLRGDRPLVSGPERAVRFPGAGRRRDHEALSLGYDSQNGPARASLHLQRLLGDQARRHDLSPDTPRLGQRRPGPALRLCDARPGQILPLHRRPGGHRAHQHDERRRVAPQP